MKAQVVKETGVQSVEFLENKIVKVLLEVWEIKITME